MPIYDSTLDYIFETDIMVEHGWDHPLHVRKRAQKEYLELKDKIERMTESRDWWEDQCNKKMDGMKILIRQNKKLVEDARRMERLMEIVEDEFDVDYCDLEEADASTCRTIVSQHQALMQEIGE